MKLRSAQRGGTYYSIFLLVVAGSILGAGLFEFIKLTHTNPFSPGFLDETPPVVTLQEAPLGIGADAVSLKVAVQDGGAGLDEVVVRISQRNEPKELLRKTYTEKPSQDETFDIQLNGKQLGLREGNAELQILAFDRSLWSNSASISKTLPVNFAKPNITVVTPQQNSVLGGSELVFYKVLGKKPKLNGVVSKSALFAGFPAQEWDPSFKSYENLYVALFPIPATFKSNADSMKLVARDEIGNSTWAPFNYRVHQRRWGSFRLSLNEQNAVRLRDRLASYARANGIRPQQESTLAGELRELLRVVTASDDATIANALKTPEPKRLWSGPFLKPVGSAPANSFGDIRVIYVGNTEVMKGNATGVRFPASSRTAVMAANGGQVVFAGDLGALGKTVVLDHGFGLVTVYGHLSEISAPLGSLVAKNQPIGRTGSTGFATSEEVHFEVRLHGVPVNPTEWWDERWVADHIDNKVAFVRTEVVGGAGE